MTTDELDGDEGNGRRPPGRIPAEQWDQERLWFEGGMVKTYTEAVQEAEDGVDRALATRDHPSFTYWSGELRRARTGLEHHEHELMRAELGRLEGDEDTPPEVLA